MGSPPRLADFEQDKSGSDQQDAQQRQPRPSGHTKKNQQDTDRQQQAACNQQRTILARVTSLIRHGIHLAHYEGMRQQDEMCNKKITAAEATVIFYCRHAALVGQLTC